MKNFLVLLIILSAVCPSFAESRIIKTYAPAPNANGYYGSYNGVSDYSYAKLAEMENAVFGRNYAGQQLQSRLDRLEDRVFNRLYPDTSPEQRINNLLYNYNRAISQNTLAPSGNKLKTIVNDITSSFFGTPTGYTPPISDTYSNWGSNGFGQRYGSYSDYYGNNGWHRYGRSAGTGSSVHILD